jgi:hypothetical protein
MLVQLDSRRPDRSAPAALPHNSAVSAVSLARATVGPDIVSGTVEPLAKVFLDVCWVMLVGVRFRRTRFLGSSS